VCQDHGVRIADFHISPDVCSKARFALGQKQTFSTQSSDDSSLEISRRSCSIRDFMYTLR
jgi:hypothetical protein